LAAVLASAVSPDCLVGQIVRGRAVDYANRRGLAEVTITVLDRESRAVAELATDGDGLFTVRLGGPGSFWLIASRLGFAPDTQMVSMGSADTLVMPAFLLLSAAIPVDTVTANVHTGDEAAVGFARIGHVVAGSRLADLDRQGAQLTAVARDIPGLRVVGMCIQSTRRFLDMRGASRCVVLVIDGIVLEDGPILLRQTLSEPLSNWESVQYLTPVEAASRFGLDAGSRGVLLLWSRGRGPHVSEDRNKR
jgi:hypothetical protein